MLTRMSPRLTQLDGLRGLAVVMVVVGHVSERAVPYGGIVGVQVFFVLSGFVITRGLVHEFRRHGRVGPGPIDSVTRWVNTAAALVAVPVVLGAARGALPVLDLHFVRWFGTISYGLYLWHYPLLRLEPAGVETSGLPRLALGVAAVGIAAASW